MILVGRNVSPFVRRTSVVLRLLGVEYEQLMLSTADDLPDILKRNPVGRVPALILDDGEVLVDSGAIIDHLLEVHDTDRRLLPASGGARRAVLRTTALAHGTMEKGVSSSYERNRRPEDKVYQDWVDRCDGQAESGLRALEAQAAAATSDWLHGDHITLGDTTAVLAYEFIRASARYVVERNEFTVLAALAAKAKAMPAFSETKP
ncbi:MAG: glutathione S-transferase family protein [Alphaproteobacteria bacterium]|nr:glutathione S-transferase family protein [Alphaproteobacteria bacterium]